FTTVPPADSVTVDAPLAPLTQIVTHTTPLTVDPAPGLVMATFSVPPVGGGGGGGGGDVVFCTVTVIVAVAVRPAASLALSASVWLPLARALVFQANEAVVPVTVWVEARVPSMVRRNVFEAPEAPPTSMPTVTVPLTVAPLAGLVKRAVSGGGGVVPCATVTLSDAEPVLPAASRALTVRVLIPSDVRRESQSSVIGMLLDVWLFTTVPGQAAGQTTDPAAGGHRHGDGAGHGRAIGRSSDRDAQSAHERRGHGRGRGERDRARAGPAAGSAPSAERRARGRRRHQRHR